MSHPRQRLLLPLLFLLGACASKGIPPPRPPQAEPPRTALPAPAPPVLSAEPAPTWREVRLLAGGDVTLGHHLPEYFEELRAKGTLSEEELTAYPFARIAPLTRGADLFWVNLEGTLTRATEKTEKNFTFKADPGDVRILEVAGVDVVNLANNHAFDFGEAGLLETLATLDGTAIAHHGAGMSLAEARRPVIVTRNGIRLGFLGYIYLGENTIEPEVLYAKEGKAGLAGTHLDLETLCGWVREDVASLRKKADVVLVSFHWGREARNLTEPYQRELARAAAEAGAGLIVGHHPHVLRGTEILPGGVPVVYSLGNLVFAGNWNPKRKDTALLEATIRVSSTGERQVMLSFIPLSVDRQPDHPFQPYPYGEKDARRVQFLIGCYNTASEEGECERRYTAGER